MNMITVDLRADARAEAHRLAGARALLRDGDEAALARLEGNATWIARSRRTAVRRPLGRRACLVWRVTIEDASGRAVESRIVPLLIDLTTHVGRVRTLLELLDGPIRERVELECDGWRRSAAAVSDAFTSARLARERRIDGQRMAASGGSQPGLFDRRAERSRQAGAATIAAAEQAALQRMHAVINSGTIATGPARLLLVLVP
jgi:hypothetical protein